MYQLSSSYIIYAITILKLLDHVPSMKLRLCLDASKKKWEMGTTSMGLIPSDRKKQYESNKQFGDLDNKTLSNLIYDWSRNVVDFL